MLLMEQELRPCSVRFKYDVQFLRKQNTTDSILFCICFWIQFKFYKVPKKSSVIVRMKDFCLLCADKSVSPCLTDEPESKRDKAAAVPPHQSFFINRGEWRCNKKFRRVVIKNSFDSFSFIFLLILFLNKFFYLLFCFLKYFWQRKVAELYTWIHLI